MLIYMDIFRVFSRGTESMATRIERYLSAPSDGWIFLTTHR